jgi:hypothetical protein
MVYYPDTSTTVCSRSYQQNVVRHVERPAADCEAYYLMWATIFLRLTSASFNDDAEVTGQLPPKTSRHNETTLGHVFLSWSTSCIPIIAARRIEACANLHSEGNHYTARASLLAQHHERFSLRAVV